MKSRSSNEMKSRSSHVVRPPVANGHATHSLNGMASLPPAVIDAFGSPSRAIDEPARSSFGTRFGHDFSRVRVHTDQLAANSAETIGAHAYTVGENIFFGASRYAPHTATGNQLLAHELAHVAQQQSSGVTTLQKFPGPHLDPFEAEANLMSAPDLGAGQMNSALHSVAGVPEAKPAPESPANPRAYSGPTAVPAPPEPEPKPEPRPEPVKVEAPPKKIPVSETEAAEKPEIEAGAKLGGVYNVGRSLTSPGLEQAGGGKFEGEVGIPGKGSLAAAFSGKAGKAEGPEEAPETFRTMQFSLEGKIPLGLWILGAKRLEQMAPFVTLKELSLGAGFSSKQQHEENMRRVFRSKAFEYSLHLIGVTLEEKKTKLGLVSFEAGLSLVGGIEGEQEVEQGRNVGPAKRTTKIGGKAGFGFKFAPRGGPAYIFVDASIEVKGNKEHGGVWFGTFEFTPIFGVGLNIGRLLNIRK